MEATHLRAEERRTMGVESPAEPPLVTPATSTSGAPPHVVEALNVVVDWINTK